MKKTLTILLLSLIFVTSLFSSKVVRIGWYDAPGLQNGDSEDSLGGYNYEYLKMIQSYTNWDLEFVFAPWKDCEQMLIDGDIDIVGDVAITPERLEKYNFCDTPNGTSSMFMIKKSDNDAIAFADFESFDGINVATIPSQYRENLIRDLAEKYDFDINLIEYPEHADMFKALNSGECDTALLSNVNEFPIDSYQIVYRSKPNSYYFIVNKNQNQILKELNSAMAQISIADSDYNDKLFERYFGDFTQKLNISYTRSDYDYIATNPSLSILTSDNLPPFSSKNEETGEFEGILIDYYKLISKKSGINFTYVVANDNTTREEQIGKSKANIGLARDDFQKSLEHNIRITQPFITFQKGFVRKIDDDSVIRKIGALEFSIIPEDLLEKYEIVYYESELDVVKAVLKKKIDAGFMNVLEYNRIIEYLHSKDLQINTTHELAMDLGISQDSDPRLFSVLDKTIGNITQQEALAIMEKNTIYHQPMTALQFIEANIVLLSLFVLINLILLALVIILRRINILKVKHNDELKVALQKAKESDEAKSIFLLSMTHDLRTPMNSIIGNSDLALSHLGDKENVKSSILEIKKASNILLGILEQLLYMSTIEQNDIHLINDEFNLEDAFSKIVDKTFRKTSVKNIELHSHFSLENPIIIGDKEKLVKVITNIVNNSIEYTKYGSINLSLTESRINDSSSLYKIVINDTGIGMTQEQKDRIFDKFYTAKGSESYKTGGLGIGLNIAKGIVDKMNGSISVDSEYKVGTTITLEIPFEIKREEENKDLAHLEDFDFSNKKLLLVEDMDINIKVLLKMLSQTKINVVVAKNGKEAYQIFKEDDNFDIIFMDIQMPIMDGYESSKLIRSLGTAKSKNVPIIAVSANTFDSDVSKVLEVGMNENFQKPISLDRLVAILEKYLGKRNL